MKIGIDIRHLAAKNPSGVGIYTLRVIKELATNNPNDQFLLFASGSKRTLDQLPDFAENNISIQTKAWPNKVIFFLLKLPFGPTLEDFMTEKPDLWLFPNFNISKTRLPYALTVHDLSFFIYPEFFTWKNRLKHWVNATNTLLKHASIVLAVSESTKMDLVEILKLPEEKILVTELGVDKVYQPKEEASDKSYRSQHKIHFPYFLTLSTLEPRKNISSVIEAYDSWRIKNISDTHLVIAGGSGWKTKAMKEAYENAWFKKDIHFIGYLAEKQKPALYRGADAFFFPSFYEGFGLPALEAMACGTPVVTSFTGSMPEVVSGNALMIDPYNLSDLEQAFDQLEVISAVLKVKGPLQAAKFTWEKTARKTYEALKKIQSFS
jgi:glycosyltransferase involved in cell wall biosynthesis